MATPSSEKRELELVEKVDFRIIAASNNEEKLQQLLKTYLPPLLLKAGSEHASVRNKIAGICQRLSTFIKPPGVVLPVAALLDQYKTNSSALARHFDLVFIQHSVGRLDPAERRELAPRVLKGIGSDPSASPLRASVFNVFLRLLLDMRIPPRGSKDEAVFRQSCGFDDARDAGYTAEWLAKLLLLRQAADSSPGLTAEDIAFLTLSKPDTWSLDNGTPRLSEVRIKATAFLASSAFTDQERFIPALLASAHSDSRVSSTGDDMLKRSSVSLEDAALVKTLFDAHKRLPAPYRVRILALLSKSKISSTFSEQILDVFRQNVPQTLVSAPQATTSIRPSAQTGMGLEASRIHKALFEFINWVSSVGAKKKEFSATGLLLIDMLKGFITAQGWPRPTTQSFEDIERRAQAYEIIGILARGISMPASTAIPLLEWLFKSLAEDPVRNVVVSIDGALSAFSLSFGRVKDNSTRIRVTSILLDYMIKEIEGDVVRSARHAATKWANAVLPFSDVFARWIDILAVAGRQDERSDVLEQGQLGLDPWTYYAHSNKTKSLPEWHAMVRKFFQEPSPRWGFGALGQTMDVDAASVFVNFPGESRLAFPVAVDYCRRILYLTAMKGFKVEPGWERQLEALVHTDRKTRDAIRTYLSSSEGHERELSCLLTAAFEGMVRDNATIAEQCSRTFVELASSAPKSSLASLASRSRELLPLIKSNRREIRTLGAKAYGILAAHPTNPPHSLAQSRDDLGVSPQILKTAIGTELNAVEGLYVALARLLSRLVYYSQSSLAEVEVGLALVFPTLSSISSASLSVQDALFEAFSQLWTAGIRGYIAPSEQPNELDFVKAAFVEPLESQARKGNDRAITALGRLAMIYSPQPPAGGEDDIVGLILEKLFGLYELKQVDVHFAVGEAIAAAIAGWDADVVRLTLDVESGDGACRLGRQPERMKEVLEKLLVDSRSTKPSLLKASGLWLFCIIQHCSHLEEVQGRLRECQAAFMRLLSARDELVQETASRGLSLVYEKGSSSLKEELVRDLVSSFTGSAPRLKVGEDTELFDAGALPTGEGNSITSYKDIVNLANEVGDQSLVYKFMSLANNAATWSTRSAFGRFGLSSILSESEIDPKLYPKLFRYRFDPNQNVQRSMEEIWKALVKDPNTVLETHFGAIMDDLLRSVLGREWRVREASCAAIADLVQGRPFQSYEAYYKDIWAATMKVMDDVKGTVREAAQRLFSTLFNSLLRQLEESPSSASSRAMIEEVLPFLLSDKGTESGVKDVKHVATFMVMKIAENGGEALKPYIPTMIPHLLGLLSTVELGEGGLDFLYLRAGVDKRDKINKFRSSMVSRSPISNAIEDCLRSVDAQVLAELVPKLEDTIKSAVGMPTKIGCGRVLGTLSMRHSITFQPYAGQFLKLMEKQILDRNDEVSKGYARAAAYIVRPAPDQARIRFSERLVSLYLGSESDERRQKTADAVLALSKISPDHFTALEGLLLPLAFLAKHDTDDYVKEASGEVWSQHAGSSHTVTRYIPEIVGLVERSLEAAQWALKHGGALATASLVAAVTSAGGLSGQVNVDNLKASWPVFEKSLALKTFPNKEKLLEVFPEFVVESRALWTDDALLGEQLKKIAIREARRNNDAYRPHAFRCLWRFSAAREDLDMLGTIYDIVHPYLGEGKDEEAMDTDNPSGLGNSSGLDLQAKTAGAAVEAISKGYNRSKMRDDAFSELERVVETLQQKPLSDATVAKASLASDGLDSIRRLFWYGCVAELMEDARKVDKPSPPRLLVLRWFLATLDLDRTDHGTEPQRLARAKAVAAILELWKKQTEISGEPLGGSDGRRLLDELSSSVESAGKTERSLDVQQKWKACLELARPGRMDVGI